MILRAAGHGGLVNPLEYGNEPRKVPAWMWAAIGVSIALHVAGGIFLYNQQFVTPAPEAANERPPIVLQRWEPVPKPKPIVEPQKPQTNVRICESLPPIVDTPISPIPPTPTATTDGDARPIISSQVEPTQSTSGTGEAPAAPGVIRNPTWISKPNSSQMERAYPQRAIESGISGKAVIQCAVTVSGALTGCSVVSETPGGKGFGAAALRLSKYFKMSPRTVDGQPVEGALVNVPISFSLN